MTYREILDEVKQYTDNFSRLSGIITCNDVKDAILYCDILSEHYNDVDIKTLEFDNEYDLKYHVTYKEPKTLDESKKQDLIIVPDYSAGVGAFNAMSEDYEKHDILNPDLFEDNELKPEVKEKLKDIVDHFIDFVKENEVDIDVDDITLVGSNASYNYTDKSDIDCHIVADVDEDTDIAKLYDAYRRLWNDKYDPTIYGHEVEIYIEPIGKRAKSNGIYSIDNGWIKEPTDDMPESIDVDISNWLVRADETETEEDIDKFFEDLYHLRQESLLKDGEYSEGNQTFKNLRDEGVLDTLKERKRNLVSKSLSLGESLLLEYDRSDLKRLVGDEYTAKFIEMRKKFPAPYNDLNYWAKLNDAKALKNYIKSWEKGKIKSKTQQKSDEKLEGAKLVFNDKGWKTYHVTTYNAAKRLGSGTTWCITGRYEGEESKGEYYFNHYIRELNLKGYYFIFDTENRDKTTGDYEKYCAGVDRSGSLRFLYNGLQDKDI